MSSLRVPEHNDSALFQVQNSLLRPQKFVKDVYDNDAFGAFMKSREPQVTRRSEIQNVAQATKTDSTPVVAGSILAILILLGIYFVVV